MITINHIDGDATFLQYLDENIDASATNNSIAFPLKGFLIGSIQTSWANQGSSSFQFQNYMPAPISEGSDIVWRVTTPNSAAQSIRCAVSYEVLLRDV